MKFRKKPVTIEAIQWDPSLPKNETTREYKGGIIWASWDCGVYLWQPPDVYIGSRKVGVSGTSFPQKARYIIDTLEGSHDVTPGDWIITGVKGERYPCKPDIFQMTYEPA